VRILFHFLVMKYVLHFLFGSVLDFPHWMLFCVGMSEEGDSVQVDELIAQIETDKVTIDIRSPFTGSVQKIVAKAGDTVTVGTLIAVVAEGAVAKPAEPKSEEAAAPPPPPPPPPPSPKERSQPAPTPPSPPPPQAAAKPPPPRPAGAGPQDPQLPPKGGERRVPMTRLRKRVATRLKDSQNTFALLTTFNEIDMTNLMELRSQYKDAFLEKHGVKLGFMSGFVKAACSALKQLPSVNAVIDGDDIIYRDYVDISIAVGTEKGLVVPVIRGADHLSFAEIEKTINVLGKKATSGTISIDDMAGGTFTISNGGVYGSLISTPIINPPQSAILGMHSIQKRPVVLGKDIVARPMMYVALTYDHRLIDGREAVLFLRAIKDIVEDPRRLLLDI
jgi:2-oxoglutarate dehydrogenase E2 component (dihydrolipoamide succinyltransferase)